MTDENGVLTVLQEYWHIILSGIALVIGYTKLNTKADQNSKDIADEALARKAADIEIETRISRQRSEDMDRIEKIMTEVRTDIKTLIKR